MERAESTTMEYNEFMAKINSQIDFNAIKDSDIKSKIQEIFGNNSSEIFVFSPDGEWYSASELIKIKSFLRSFNKAILL